MKTFLIPLAAFAVTVTSASAFSPDMLRKAGLNDDQISAFEQAKELKESGDKEAARDVLIEAGIDEEVIKQVREAMREYRGDILAAIEDEDYEAFLEAISGSAFADIIDSREEFDLLVEAHARMQDGDSEAAKDIFEELGLTGPFLMMKLKEHNKKFSGPFGPFYEQLSEEERGELKAAIRDGDKDKVRDILESAGIEWSEEKWEKGRGRDGWGFGHWNKIHKPLLNSQ